MPPFPSVYRFQKYDIFFFFSSLSLSRPLLLLYFLTLTDSAVNAVSTTVSWRRCYFTTIMNSIIDIVFIIQAIPNFSVILALLPWSIGPQGKFHRGFELNQSGNASFTTTTEICKYIYGSGSR